MPLPLATTSDVWLPEFVYNTLKDQLPGVGDAIYPAGSVPIGAPGPYVTQETIASIGISDLGDFEGHAYDGTLQLGIYVRGYSQCWKTARLASRLIAESAPNGRSAFSKFLSSDLGKDPDTGLNYIAVRCDFLETNPSDSADLLFVNGDLVGAFVVSVNGDPVSAARRR